MVLFFHPFFILLFFNPFFLQGQFQFNNQNEAAYNAFLNLKIEEGQGTLRTSLQNDPTNGVTIYLENYADAIRIFLSEDEKSYKVLSKNEDIRIKKIQSLNKNSPYYLFLQAEIRLHWAFVKLKMGNEISAMNNIRSAYKLLEENIKKYPDFLPNKKSMGLLNIIIGSIPSNYNWVLSLVGMNGDINKGMEQLEEVSETKNPYQLEATIIKTIAQNYIIHAHEGRIDVAKQLYLNNSNNLLITYLYAAILTKNSICSEALTIISNRTITSETIYFPHIDLILGELNLYKGDFEESRKYYQNFLQKFKGKNSLKDTYFKLFLTFWLNDEDEKAMLQFNKILNNGRTLYDSDKQAQRIALNNEIPNKSITQIRLYTDGGYYSKAFELLNQLTLGQFHSKRDKLEYLYRSARLNHKAGRISDAITYYQKTIELSKESTYYFAPNSALQLGYIYQFKNENVLAENYFKLALSYKNHEYKNSIDNKAKAALNELKKSEK